MTNSAPDGDPRPICDYENSSYRTDFWEDQGRDYEDLAERVALRRLLPPAGQRLLDIGAGFGRLASLYDGYKQVVLLDYSFSQLAYARSRLGDERFTYVAADIYRLPLATNAVDTTVMVRVLHHLADVPLALQQIARVIRPQGTFILEFANKRHIKNILKHVLGRTAPDANPYRREPYEFAPLHFDYHPTWVADQLEHAGFAAERRLSVSLFRMGFLKRRIPPALLARVDGALQSLTAPLAPAPSIFIRSAMLKPGLEQVVPVEQLFRCPSCGHEPLAYGEGGLLCAKCDATWPVQDGIYNFKASG